MDELIENKEKNRENSLKNLIPFKPGQSGNPGGRPKNTLKDYVKEMFIKMSDEEKKNWLKDNKITGIDQWKMGEGLPRQDLDIKGEIETKIISIDE